MIKNKIIKHLITISCDFFLKNKNTKKIITVKVLKMA